MCITPPFIYARPSAYYAGLRNGIEGAILDCAKAPADPLRAAWLDSMQAGFNDAIKREQLDIPPLTLKTGRISHEH